jgi:hypothetical protein
VVNLSAWLAVDIREAAGPQGAAQQAATLDPARCHDRPREKDMSK